MNCANLIANQHNPAENFLIPMKSAVSFTTPFIVQHQNRITERTTQTHHAALEI